MVFSRCIARHIRENVYQLLHHTFKHLLGSNLGTEEETHIESKTCDLYLENDSFLVQWRTTIVEHFNLHPVEITGWRGWVAEYIVENHLDYGVGDEVIAWNPTMDHALRTQTFLANWAAQNFPPDRAQELKATLKRDAAP